MSKKNKHDYIEPRPTPPPPDLSIYNKPDPPVNPIKYPTPFRVKGTETEPCSLYHLANIIIYFYLLVALAFLIKLLFS